MPHKVVHGFAWYTYPDVLGLESEDAVDPGHPFADRPGEIHAPPEVLYYRSADANDSGLRNERHAHSYLVMTKTQLHPKLSKGWESEPAVLSDGFKTQDGKVKMVKMVEVHHRHSGKLLECELKVEDA